ncbi:MAG: DNA mismatch repair protein MutS, partial [Oscillospiraceae bacterium]|nr:DNA mismatch repair protein MutS [Oscillospiraceae bacterium]
RRGDDISFLRRIARGVADGSYGVEVAKLAGVPQTVVNRARVILKELEKHGAAGLSNSISANAPAPSDEPPENDMNNEAIKALKNIDVDTLTPIEAMTVLYDIKNRLI